VRAPLMDLGESDRRIVQDILVEGGYLLNKLG
jgi:hypothetical protein